MVDPEEVLHAFLGELYRYRLAVQDQLVRIRAATQAVRAQRDRIEKEIDELLFAPSMSMDDFEHQLRANHGSDIPELWRLKTEGEFLLGSVYGAVTMAKAIRRVAGGDAHGCVQRALSAFEKAAPDADLLRHLHVHIDAYVLGEGKDAARLPNPGESEGAIGMLEEGPVYFIGGKLFVLSDIAGAAEELARAVAACVGTR